MVYEMRGETSQSSKGAFENVELLRESGETTEGSILFHPGPPKRIHGSVPLSVCLSVYPSSLPFLLSSVFPPSSHLS